MCWYSKTNLSNGFLRTSEKSNKQIYQWKNYIWWTFLLHLHLWKAFRLAINVTSYGKPERVWRIWPECLAGNLASDKCAVAWFFARRITLKFTSRNACVQRRGQRWVLRGLRLTFRLYLGRHVFRWVVACLRFTVVWYHFWRVANVCCSMHFTI
jgi:hypothetical protein